MGSNGSSVEEIWNIFKDIVSESIGRFVPHKILRQIPDPEYYSKEVKRLKIKVRKAYNKRKLGQHHLEEFKRLSKQLIVAKNGTRDFFRSILDNGGKCRPDCYKYIKRRKGYRENVPAVKDCNGRPIVDPIEKANSLNPLNAKLNSICYLLALLGAHHIFHLSRIRVNYYYSSAFSSEGNIPHIQCTNSGEPFATDTKIIR